MLFLKSLDVEVRWWGWKQAEWKITRLRFADVLVAYYFDLGPLEVRVSW
jgi:hypothetical protein